MYRSRICAAGREKEVASHPGIREQSAVAAGVGRMDRCRARALQLGGVHLCPITRRDARCCAVAPTDSADSRWRICSPISRHRAAENPLEPKRAALSRPKAKSVIFLFMDGGLSQMDSFDPKPRLRQDHGKPIPMKTPTTVFNIGDKVSGLALRVQAIRPVGRPGQRTVSARRHLRR